MKTWTTIYPSRKECIVCRRKLLLAEYYTHPAAVDGHLGRCKECCRADAWIRRVEKGNEIRSQDRARSMLSHRVRARTEYLRTPDGRTAHTRATRRWQQRNKHKRNAHMKVVRALKNGLLIKHPCQVVECGNPRVEAHHADYDRPLLVVWLCTRHHKEAHKVGTKHEVAV